MGKYINIDIRYRNRFGIRSYQEDSSHFASNCAADTANIAFVSLEKLVRKGYNSISNANSNIKKILDKTFRGLIQQGSNMKHGNWGNYLLSVAKYGFDDNKRYSIYPLTKNWLKYKENEGGHRSHFTFTGDLLFSDIYNYLSTETNVEPQEIKVNGENLDMIQGKDFEATGNFYIPYGDLAGYKLMTYGCPGLYYKHVSRNFFPAVSEMIGSAFGQLVFSQIRRNVTREFPDSTWQWESGLEWCNVDSEEM